VPNPAVPSPTTPSPADFGTPVAERAPQPGRAASATPVPETKLCEEARILARVGPEVILASEVLPAYRETLDRIPKSRLEALPAERVELEKKALLSKLLEERIQTKLLYLEAKRSIPEEGFPELESQIAKAFEKKEIPQRIKKAGVESRRELDEKLRSIGTSLDRIKRQFIEQALASQWLHQENDRDPTISHQEMYDYYQEHLADFETPARARWERLSVRKPRYGDPAGARAKLARLGNQVMQGASIADVLKAEAGEEPECAGGTQGWITQNSLEVSPTLEQAIFGLPVGRLSQIFEDADCFHIVRVLEREEATRTEFGEAQSEIREKLQTERWQEQVTEYLAKLKEQTPVWTVFDDDPQLAELRRQREAARK
jgi:hypothetical protein